MATDTDGLLQVEDVGTQTTVSFASGQFDKFIVDQPELNVVFKKINFSKKLAKMMGVSTSANFVREPRMRTFLAGDGHELIDEDDDEEEGFEKLMKELFENYAYEAE